MHSEIVENFISQAGPKYICQVLKESIQTKDLYNDLLIFAFRSTTITLMNSVMTSLLPGYERCLKNCRTKNTVLYGILDAVLDWISKNNFDENRLAKAMVKFYFELEKLGINKGFSSNVRELHDQFDYLTIQFSLKNIDLPTKIPLHAEFHKSLIICFAEKCAEFVRTALDELYTESEIETIYKNHREVTVHSATQTESLLWTDRGKRRKTDSVFLKTEEVKVIPSEKNNMSSSKREMSPEEITEARIALEESKRKLSLQQRETKRLTSPLYAKRAGNNRVIYVARGKVPKVTQGEECKVRDGTLWELFEKRRVKENEEKCRGELVRKEKRKSERDASPPKENLSEISYDF